MQLIKGGSAKWVHETFPEHRLFGWQVKYGAFSVSVSRLEKHDRLHQESGGTPPQDELPGGVFGFADEASH
jgi:hypothetical protein